MFTAPWQLELPLNAVIFDCDGTLSRIEGIDELANDNQVGDIVQRLTQDAMGKSGMNVDLYAKRLDLTKPSQAQVDALGLRYFEQRTPPIAEVVALLQRLNKTVYIVSGGFLPAVAKFAEFLNIKKEHVFAVDLYFNEQGEYRDFDRSSPLINKNGKRVLVEKIKALHPRTAFIGDGLSDLEVEDLVTRFVGYGGAYFRQNIAEVAEFYVKKACLSPLLPLFLTLEEARGLTSAEQAIYQAGVEAIQSQQVGYNNPFL
jgi:phosphoserine phosphatase